MGVEFGIDFGDSTERGQDLFWAAFCRGLLGCNSCRKVIPPDVEGP